MKKTWDPGKRSKTLVEETHEEAVKITREPNKRPETLVEFDPDDVIPPSLHLKVMQDLHEEADHGIYAIRAMVYCYEARIKPPQWVVDWIGGGFARWLDRDESTIDKALSAASPGPGHQHPLNRLVMENARFWDAHIMFILITVFHFSVDNAAEMHQRRTEAHGRKSRDAGWLAESYRENWRDIVKPGVRDSIIESYQDEERRKNFLASFPPK